MRYLRRFFSHWRNWLPVLFLLGCLITAIFAPKISPENPKDPGAFPHIADGLKRNGPPLPPGEKAPLGTLPNHVDVFHPLIWGARDALKFGLTVSLSALIFGILYGAVAGYIGKRWGRLMIYAADTLLAFPVIAAVVFLQQLLVTTITATGGMYFYNAYQKIWIIEIVGTDTPIQWLLERINPLMFALIALSWMPYARIIYSNVILLMETEFILAARMVGGSSWWILRKHLIPNSFAPLLVLAARDVGSVVILQATLTVIHIGGDSIWGDMLARGKDWVIGPGGNLLTYWWVYLPPTLAIMLFGASWNMLGDGLVDAFEPGSPIPGKGFLNKRKPKNEPTATAAVFPRRSLAHAKVVVNLPPELDPLLQAAHEFLAAHDLEKALHVYSYLISHGRQAEAVVRDMLQVARQFPGHAHVWKVLGDAFTLMGNHEYAAKAYAYFRKITAA
jgi:ABC-type dipeptide/oligopeptide/nickel transport system permease subunit